MAVKSFSPIIIALLFLQTWAHGSGRIPRDAWPESWFAAPKTASELGITNFHESPMLAEQAGAGTLPPLRNRLPDDPFVIEPAERTGKYGGTLRCFTRDVDAVRGIEPPLTMDPEVSIVLPNLASGWKYSEDARTLTLSLRQGLRWSDGHPFTSAAFVFWHQHISLNKELTPAQSLRWQGASVTAEDALTVSFRFLDPHPYFAAELAHHGDVFYAPGHFLKDFHTDFVAKEVIDARVKEEEFMSWAAYFNSVRANRMAEPNGVPVMYAYTLTRKSPTLQVWERNPFYPKIDPEGNQLPYMNRIQVMMVENKEVIAAKTATGQVHFSGNSIETQDIALFKMGQRANNYRTYVWNRIYGVDVVIQPNLTCLDPELRDMFRDFRFRKALSFAINREEINTIVYFGRATPRQTTVIPSSRFFEPEFADAYIEYRPDEARRLLDEMGIQDRNIDGIRERHDGKPLSITLEFFDFETPKGITMELVSEYWRDIGIQLNLKQVAPGLQGSRARANQMEMTLWHADRTSDILFPSEPFWFVPMHNSWEECHWPLWSTYYLSDGERGEAPPPQLQQLVDWWREMTTIQDAGRRIELGKKILRSHAENLWTIGTLGLSPKPVVVHNSLHNIPVRGYWGWDNRWTLPYHPETWFIE